MEWLFILISDVCFFFFFFALIELFDYINPAVFPIVLDDCIKPRLLPITSQVRT